MYLSDELLEIVNKSKIETQQDLINLHENLLSASLRSARISIEISGNRTNEIIRHFRRVNTTWAYVARELSKQSKPVIAEDGFKLFCKNHESFKKVATFLQSY